jgi:hypothetical protein
VSGQTGNPIFKLHKINLSLEGFENLDNVKVFVRIQYS